MNWLEKGICSMAPQWGARRSAARVRIQAYEAALPSKGTTKNREGKSADQAVWMAGKSLREQARWLDENHDLVIGIFDKFEERIVGADGIMVEPQPLNLQGQIHTQFAEELRRRWAAWSLKPDVTGRFTRPELERIVLRSALRDGEVFAQMVRGNVPGLKHPNPQGTAFSIEALEADFVPMENVLADRIRQGVQTNAWGQVQAYKVFHSHPAETLAVKGGTKMVPAGNMLHLAFRRRLHQLRGITIIHGIITRLNDIKSYEEAERVAARIAACLGFYIKKNNVEGDEDYETPDERHHFNIEPGMVYDKLQPGEDIGMVESNRPNVHLTDFRNGQVRMVAAGSRAQYSSVSRDYNGTYSAQRQELVESWEGFAVLQNWFVGAWARPVYRAWLQMELLNGLTIPADLDMATLFDAVYLAPVMPWINPVHESTAWATRVKGGAASTAQWVRAGGKNPTETWRQIEDERRYFKERGLSFDTNPTGDNNNEKQQSQPDGEDPEEIGGDRRNDGIFEA